MKNKSGELNGFLDRGSSFRGELEFEDTMRIDGRFNGKRLCVARGDADLCGQLRERVGAMPTQFHQRILHSRCFPQRA